MHGMLHNFSHQASRIICSNPLIYQTKRFGSKLASKGKIPTIAKYPLSMYKGPTFCELLKFVYFFKCN